ncbi:MAG: hypothetical protein P8N58_03525, partial [Emcibacteraceae bacterium]|nr:hypothetical protein [Emcibacteraceae bacterium]
MAAQTQMLAGLAGLLGEDNEKKFARERSFGKKLLITAWAVEIMAALLGLLIAFFMSYDAYNNTADQGNSAIFNAILGGLPFLLIAIIEPTKIPLAGGLYKVKHWGWKTLILVALLGLTFVTFETMFTGLERQVENLTEQISRGENKIKNLEDDIALKEQKISEIEALSIPKLTKDLDQLIENSYIKEQQDIKVLEEKNSSAETDLNKQIAIDESRIREIYDRKEDQQEKVLSALDQPLQNSKDNIAKIEQKIRKVENQISTSSQEDAADGIVETLDEEIKQIQRKIEETSNLLRSNESEQIKKAQVIIGVIDDGKVGNNTNRNFELWKNDREVEIQQ